MVITILYYNLDKKIMINILRLVIFPFFLILGTQNENVHDPSFGISSGKGSFSRLFSVA